MDSLDKKEIEVLEKLFENLLIDFRSNQKLNISKDKSNRIQNFVKDKCKAINIKNNEDVILSLVNNFDVQIENIYMQTNIILKFCHIIKKLEQKPDDEKSLQALVEYKKSLGLI
jgi:hypothetical protein